jgi:hypothetical protein
MGALKSVANFFEFAFGVLRGLAIAIGTDVNVFVLALSALLMSFGPTRWVGLVALVYVVLRQFDQYVAALTNR